VPNSTWDDFILLRAKFNGANSSIQVNDTAAGTGNVGTTAAAGVCLGARNDRFQPAEVTYKDVVIRTVNDSAGVYAAIGHGIRYRNGFFLT
jgi:hypothetical protein